MEGIWQMCISARLSSGEWPGEKETSKEDVKTEMAALKELKASAASMGLTLHTTIKYLRENGKEKGNH